VCVFVRVCVCVCLFLGSLTEELEETKHTNVYDVHRGAYVCMRGEVCVYVCVCVSLFVCVFVCAVCVLFCVRPCVSLCSFVCAERERDSVHEYRDVYS